VELWSPGIGELVVAGDDAPTPSNGWLSILRAIDRAVRDRMSPLRGS
jgi:hypothetical protein